jgi:lysozyme C
MNLFIFLALFYIFAEGLDNPAPINYLNINNYLGHWKTVYQAPTNIIFQGYGSCMTADYGLLENGNINVINSQINENNELEQIFGYGYYKNISEPGKLTVHLDGVPVDSPYWIVQLGESINNQYQYSIITTPSYISLWVLTRDIDTFYELYDDQVIEFLNKYNFKYVPISQNNCNYNNINSINRVNSDNSIFNKQFLRSNYQTDCQIASYLKKSGFPDYTIPTMVCISKYESSYNCDATNKNTDGSTDYGLFQINSYYWCSGDTLSKYNECKIACSSLFNCQYNTNCAYIVWKQQGFTAWYGYQKHKSECDSYKIYC